MPIIGRDARGRPHMIDRTERQISKLPMRDLITLEEFLWKCMDGKAAHHGVVDTLNAIHREVEWRAQDTEFQ